VLLCTVLVDSVHGQELCKWTSDESVCNGRDIETHKLEGSFVGRLSGQLLITVSHRQLDDVTFASLVNLLMGTGSYTATSNDMKLVHWPLMGGLLHLVQRGGAWAGRSPPRPLLAVPNSPPIKRSLPITALLCVVRCSAVVMWALKG